MTDDPTELFKRYIAGKYSPLTGDRLDKAPSVTPVARSHAAKRGTQGVVVVGCFHRGFKAVGESECPSCGEVL